MREPTGFREFVDAQSSPLLRSAWLITGDWHSAQDLVQTALMKTWPRWEHLVRRDRPEVYVRRVMVTTYLSSRRRRWVGETPVADVPEVAAAIESDLETKQALLAAVKALPDRQRAAITLRYFDDLTEADTAAALGCSIGTVKTHCSRALERLRTMPALAAALDPEGT